MVEKNVANSAENPGKMLQRLIDADALWESVGEIKLPIGSSYGMHFVAFRLKEAFNAAPTIDAVPIEHLKSWLLEIAMNNVGNALGDSCEELVLRIEKGGLSNYVRDKEKAD